MNHLETKTISHSNLLTHYVIRRPRQDCRASKKEAIACRPKSPAKASFCALLIRRYCTEMLTASNSMKTMNSCHVRRNTICSGFNAPLIRPRPALKLLTVLNQQEGRVPSNSQRPLVSCQRSRLSQTRKTMHTPEVCFEPEVQKPVPAWQRLASFLLKSTAMVALALALVSCQGQSNQRYC